VICAIVLAAGSSSRFGETKQLLELDGKPLAQHAIDAAVGAGLDHVVVVLGHDADRVEAHLQLHANTRIIVNARYGEGQSSSLAAGLAAMGPRCEAALVLLADQPADSAMHVRTLMNGWRERRSPIARLRFRDGPGPAVLARETWPTVAGQHADTGARAVMAAHQDWVEEIPIDDPAPLDVDTRADWKALQRERPHQPGID